MGHDTFYRTMGALSDGSLGALWLAAGAVAGSATALLSRLRRKRGRI